MRYEPACPAPVQRCVELLAAAAIAIALLTATAPLRAQQTACNCSCEAYSEMLQLAEQARVAAESGNYEEIPAEAANMGRCAGRCAMQWGQCANPGANPAAADSPSAAADAPAAAERMLQMQQRRRQEEEQPSPGLPKEQLSADYLQGMWCSVYGGQERTQWRFDAQGRYEIGVPAGRGYAMQGNFRSLRQFHERFDRLVAFESDTFTTEHINGRISRENVFTRGPCQ